MSRDEVHIRDRLLMLAESTRPFNVKRKAAVAKQQQAKVQSQKLSMQDFVRMDPSYTPDIEHLVFPGRKRNPQQVAPAVPPPANKTRSRLAEMFALSRHLQQRSADRESKPRNTTVNRSVDSVLEAPRDRRVNSGDRRWATEEQPVHSTRHSPSNEPDMATTRGPNVSVLHLRSTSEPWETSPTSVFTVSTGSSRSYSSGRTSNTGASLTKHESLGGPTYTTSSSSYNKYNQRSDSYTTTDMYLGSCHRELSPVRWCDKEVDGVYLNRSGWVQVQHRSLDDSRRGRYVENLQQAASRRTGLKLAEYQHVNPKIVKPEPQRPVYLPLKNSDFERISRTPSPNVQVQPESPPSVTPIISPPPAFQDRNKSTKSRTFFGKAPFLPRSNAIIDSDVSPPPSPPATWKNTKTSSLPPVIQRKQKASSPATENTSRYRIPQTKSLEDTSAARRTKFVQKHGESSSSSSQSQSSSMGFRSLDSYVPRCAAMPRLSENTDSSIDVYEDADDEDNNSSSLNISIKAVINSPIEAIHNRPREKISPSGRASRMPYRSQIRRSPVGSDAKPTSPGSSSSSSNEFPSRSPSGTVARRTPPSRQYPEDPSSRVRRSRSLQLPDKRNPPQTRISPQHPDTYRVIKVGNNSDRPKRHSKPHVEENLDEEMLREAEVVTGFLYGSRSRAAAQALLMHRYNNNNGSREDKPKEVKPSINNGYNVYVVGSKDRQKVLQRGSTAPSLNNAKSPKSSCSSDSCDFWPHCSHREPLPVPPPPMMRSSQSYPSHQRSLDVPPPTPETNRSLDREPYKKRTGRSDVSIRKRNGLSPSESTETAERKEKRLSPNRSVERKVSPVKNALSVPSGSAIGSSSGSDVYVSTEKPKSQRSVGTPPDEDKYVREVILTRPGSAPGTENKASFVDSQQRSMSLPKSFLSKQGGQLPWKRRGTESLGSSPGFQRKGPTETSQTAPVTPLHDGNRRRSPVDEASRRTKATSTPQLIDPRDQENRKWKTSSGHGYSSKENRKGSSANSSESVLQKFRKTFSLRFQKKGSKESCTSDIGDGLSEILGEPSEEESPQHVPSSLPSTDNVSEDKETHEPVEQKPKFGSLIWRSSKERKKLNKAARNVKCNSGDSGIQIEAAARIA